MWILVNDILYLRCMYVDFCRMMYFALWVRRSGISYLKLSLLLYTFMQLCFFCAFYCEHTDLNFYCEHTVLNFYCAFYYEPTVLKFLCILLWIYRLHCYINIQYCKRINYNLILHSTSCMQICNQRQSNIKKCKMIYSYTQISNNTK